MTKRITMLSLFLVTTLVGTMIGIQPLAHAQQDERCFPETGYCIGGRFLEYWEQNGGLPVFGFPISNAEVQTSPSDGMPYLTQWFERNRFELHPENSRPYDVLLGLLGIDALAMQGRDWQTFPQADSSTAHYFAETGHAIAPEFIDYWTSHGLEFDGEPGSSLAESLALFGFPISPATMETNVADGQEYLTQWFERARFELHPENEMPVLLGLLGNELQAALVDGPLPQPEPQPEPLPEPQPEPQPEPGNAAGITGVCATNAPTLTDGAQVWVTNANPSPGEEITVCASLRENGAPKVGTFYTLQLFYGPDYEPTFESGLTDDQGVAAKAFTINPTVSSGAQVRADAAFANYGTVSTHLTVR